MQSRRKFLSTLPAGLLCVGHLPGVATGLGPNATSGHLQLSPMRGVYRPLDTITVHGDPGGRMVVLDGKGRVYFDRSVTFPVQFCVGGALGTQSILLLDAAGMLQARAYFKLDVGTGLREESGEYEYLLKTLYWTMASDGPVGVRRHKGKVYSYWDNWVLDNTNSLRGMRYFWPEVRTGFEIFAETQREDGMIWENHLERTPPENYWDWRFKYGDFSRAVDGGYVGLRRAPVENHVEAYYLEFFNLVWQTTGDDEWMRQYLDHALRAVHYSTNDPYRWSKKYGLLKRGLTIDTWDFLCESEAALTGDAMTVDLTKTHFGVFFGDNTEFISGCRSLAGMLESADRPADAADMRKLAGEMEGRLDRLSWNGRFFTHWVPEDPDFKPDFGVDQSGQVSLSNAYSLNRGIAREKARAILDTYRSIRREMPSSSPGEFYSIFPPFAKGFGAEESVWEYVNGGVLACTAGELARGAFENGEEEYGVDVLKRLIGIARSHRDFVPGILRGKEAVRPKTEFSPIDLRALANCDTGKGTEDVPGWVDEPGNYLLDFPEGAQTFRGVSFQVLEGVNCGGRVCVGLSHMSRYAARVQVPIHRGCNSFYLLHACSGNALTPGRLVVHYEDGVREVVNMERGVNLDGFWAPMEADEFNLRYGILKQDVMQIAWRGRSPQIDNVCVWITAFTPQRQQQPIASFELESMEGDSKWFVLGITLSDQPAFLPPWSDVSTGMPNNWGAGCVTAALLEGLAGVVDARAGMRAIRLSPRWEAAKVRTAEVAVRYPASDGYCAYTYHAREKGLEIAFTGNAEVFETQIQLPLGRKVARVRLDGDVVETKIVKVGASSYVALPQAGAGTHNLNIDYA